jgi:hypothetical protein
MTYLMAFLVPWPCHILKVMQDSLAVAQKEQNANSVNILFALNMPKHITSVDSQITRAGKLRTLKQPRQAANILMVNNMREMIKDFESWYSKLPAPYKEDFMNTPALGEWAAKGFNAGHKACQSINDNRIQQLLAVIELQRQALIAAQNAIDEYDYTGTKEMSDKYIIAERLCAEAVAIKPQDVELVEVGEADFDKPAGTVNLDIYNIDFDGIHKLYTIKTKG